MPPKRKNAPLTANKEVTAKQEELQRQIMFLKFRVDVLAGDIRKQSQLGTKVSTDIQQIQNSLNGYKYKIELLRAENNKLLHSISVFQIRLNVEAAPSTDEKELHARKIKYVELFNQLTALEKTQNELELKLGAFTNNTNTFQSHSGSTTIVDFLGINNHLQQVKSDIQIILQELSALDIQIEALDKQANQSKMNRTLNHKQIMDSLILLETKLNRNQQELATKLELQRWIEKDLDANNDISRRIDEQRRKLVGKKIILEKEREQLKADLEATFEPKDKQSRSKGKSKRKIAKPVVSPVFYFLPPQSQQLSTTVVSDPNNNNNGSNGVPVSDKSVAQDASANRDQVHAEASARISGNAEVESFEEFYKRFMSDLSPPQSSNNNDNNNTVLPLPISSGPELQCQWDEIFETHDDVVVSEEFVQSFFGETTNNNNNNNSFNQGQRGSVNSLPSYLQFLPPPGVQRSTQELGKPNPWDYDPKQSNPFQ